MVVKLVLVKLLSVEGVDGGGAGGNVGGVGGVPGGVGGGGGPAVSGKKLPTPALPGKPVADMVSPFCWMLPISCELATFSRQNLKSDINPDK